MLYHRLFVDNIWECSYTALTTMVPDKSRKSSCKRPLSSLFVEGDGRVFRRSQKMITLAAIVVLFVALIWAVISASTVQAPPTIMPVQRNITLPSVLSPHSSPVQSF